MSQIKLNKKKFRTTGKVIIIIAAIPDDPWSSQIPKIQTAHCGECAREVITTPYQRSYAEQQSDQTGKPIDILCVSCMMTYAEHETPECSDTCWMCRAEKSIRQETRPR